MKHLGFIFLSLLLLQCSHQTPSARQQGQQDVGPETPEEPGREESKDEVDARNKTYRFAIISDLNGSYGSTSYNSNVKKAVDFIADKNNKIDFAISTGDMVAGQKSNLDYKAMWNAFHQTVTRPLLKADIALLPSPGNHDASLGWTIERSHYEQSWNKENVVAKAVDFKFVEGVKQNYPFQYAFSMGKALFISLDDTAARQWNQSTVDWIENVLARESDAKLKFVYGHVPLLPFAFKKEREYVARGDVTFLRQIEGLFDRYKVDVFFSGHSHVYYPGRRGQHTEFISVPLLGSGSRHLISRQTGLAQSERGFLIIEYDHEGNWKLNHHRSEDYQIVSDNEFPTVIDMPADNTNLCPHCSQFPSSHFLDAKKRVIYQRRDQ